MKRETPRILLLEPNALQCDLIRMALLRSGMDVRVCKQPSTLHQQLVEYRPDALLIDTYLPGSNGLDLIGQLQASASLQSTRIFFISSLGFTEIVQRAIQIGASGFFVKPLDTNLLVTRIQSSITQ